VTAQRCEFGEDVTTPYGDSYRYTSLANKRFISLTSQDQADVLFKDCTILVDDIRVSNNYTGKSLSLPGIRELKGQLATEQSGITELILDDLAFANVVRLDSYEDEVYLSTFSAPKLTIVQNIVIEQVNASILLPSLTSIGVLQLGDIRR